MSKKSVEDMVRGFTATHKKTVAMAGAGLRDSMVGIIMGEFMDQGVWPTSEEFLSAVQKRISDTASSREKMDVSDDLGRAPLENIRVLMEGLIRKTDA